MRLTNENVLTEVYVISAHHGAFQYLEAFFLSFVNGPKIYYSLRVTSLSMSFVQTVREYRLTIHVTRQSNKTEFSRGGRLDLTILKTS